MRPETPNVGYLILGRRSGSSSALAPLPSFAAGTPIGSCGWGAVVRREATEGVRSFTPSTSGHSFFSVPAD